MTHRFVLITANEVTGNCESAALLRDLRVPVICKPFDIETVCTVVADIIAR